MRKNVYLLLMVLALSSLKAQITPSISIPDGIRNFDGSYDEFGQSHLFYPNAGEIRFSNKDENAIDFVQYYTMNTHPKQFLLNSNNISLGYWKKATDADVAAGGTDSLQRVDIEWQRSNGSAFLARVDTQKFARLFYYDQYFAASGGRMVEGGAAIACQSIYNNIDLVYTSNNAGLVMYFIVYPGGNYKDILMHFAGANSTSIVGNKLVAQGSWDKMIFQKPQMYQYVISGGVVTPVTVCNSNWVNTGTDTYQLNNSSSTPYNTSLPLIIQIKQNNAVTVDTPGLCWSTYFGGWGQEYMTKNHTDASDNLYIAGTTGAINNTFPQAQGLQPTNPKGMDGAICKFGTNQKLQWSVFVGGSSNEDIRDFDFYGNSIFCVGRTSSDNTASVPFPTLAKTGAFNDATWGGGTAPWDGFIWEFTFSALSSTFTTNWLTYFGGNGWDELYGCKIDGSGNLYIAGASSSDNMSIQAQTGGYLQNFNNAQLNSSTPISTDGIIGKFNAAGAQQWFTFCGSDVITGGNGHTHAADYFYGITLAGNDVYVCGKSGGTNLPSAVNSKFVGSQFDGILANFSTNGALLATKYTDGNIANYAVKENSGEVITVGEANSSMGLVNSGNWFHNPTASGTTDGCFSVHTSNLSATTTHNSFLGGSAEDAANDVQFTTNNLMIISGNTHSSDFPNTILTGMYNQSFAGGINDNFVAAFQKTNTSILWSSCLGSASNESNDFPQFINSGFEIANTTISLDSQNRLRLLGSTTSFNTFPMDDGGGGPTGPYFQPQSGLGNDASVTCFDMGGFGFTVGLKDFPNTQFSFGLYPNPTNKNLTITNTVMANDDLRYAIYDANGKKLQVGNLKASETKNIDVSMLQEGIYFINVSNGKNTYSNKFIKVAD